MYTQILPYISNSAELFDHFAHLPYAIFLDSCLPQQNQGQYDIIVAEPAEIIECGDNIFSMIQEKLNSLKKKAKLSDYTQNDYNLPFRVGALGYLSYDIGRTLEKIPTIAVDDIALPKALVGIYEWSIVVDHKNKKTIFTSLHALNHPKTQRVFHLLKINSAHEKKFSLISEFKSNMTKEDYSHAFYAIKKNIFAGNCYQINLAQRYSAEFLGSAWTAYQTLRQKNAAPYAAFINLPKGAILSLSPERFIKVHNRVVETKPIKGTSPRFADEKKDNESANTLLSSEKNRAENVMIVDLLRNDLSRACNAGSVQVPALCALESFTNVHHLVSTITGKLSDQKNSLDLFQQCFPGGSITGAPKISAMKIIESLEPHRRSLYCGSIFYLDISDRLDSNIAIRTVICDDNKMHCYAGGGIVQDSECEAEYAETEIKVGKIIRTLGIRDQGSV